MLVAEDEDVVREATVTYVLADGHAVDAAAGGREALKRLRAGRYDLVLTDRGMPGMSGDEVAAAVKAASPRTPVVLLMGFGELLKATGERPEGVDLVVGKPLTRGKLRAALASVGRTA